MRFIRNPQFSSTSMYHRPPICVDCNAFFSGRLLCEIHQISSTPIFDRSTICVDCKTRTPHWPRCAPVDQQRERCVRGRELIAHFLDFNSGDPARLAPVFGACARAWGSDAGGGGGAGKPSVLIIAKIIVKYHHSCYFLRA